MILGHQKLASLAAEPKPTIDELFLRGVGLRPDAIALTDPPNREAFTDGAPMRLTYAEADRAVSAIAARLRELGLATDTVVAVQLPNVVEFVLTLLGIWRAGMIAAPLPLLWRRAEMSRTLSRIGAKAFVTMTRVDNVDHCDLAMQVAADVFPIRYVCAFGSNVPDGIVPFDDLLSVENPESAPSLDRGKNLAAHVAVVTWDTTPEGLIPVARSHAELIAGGVTTVVEARLGPDTHLLACCTMSSFAGLSLSITPWLIAGGRLSLHHPFEAEVFASQCEQDHCDTIALPGPLIPLIAEAGLLRTPTLKNVVALWRAPERLGKAEPWNNPDIELIDMMAFGELALLGVPRNADGRTRPIAAGKIMAPQGSDQGLMVAETARSGDGTLVVRGSMVPRHAFPPGAERQSTGRLKADTAGFVDTGYSCRHDPETRTFELTAPPPGVVTVGGCRFVLSDLEKLVRQVHDDAAMAALPDSLSGHRLAGIAEKHIDMQKGLYNLGANALVIDAFQQGNAG
jgi:AMP-binding enzyme